MLRGHLSLPQPKDSVMWWVEPLVFFLKAYVVFMLGVCAGFFLAALMRTAKEADEQADRAFRVGFRDKL